MATRTKNRLRITDFQKIQTTLKEKAQRERETIVNLMDLPDCDQLMKNNNYEKILDEIPQEKKINFFAKNYKNFLQTQQELMSFKLPHLSQIPKAKQFHLKLKEQTKAEQDPDEANVMEIIDSFSNYVLEKNTQEVLRLHKIIMDMKEHSKYSKYFYKYSINKIFREAYISFVENCRDFNTLMKLKEKVHAIKVFLEEKETTIFAIIKTDLAIDSSVASLKKALRFLLNQIQANGQTFRVQFQQYLEAEPELTLYFPKWISKVALLYYNAIESLIYEEQEIASILQNLSELLETSKEIQTKGISLYRELRNLISTDLPSHLQKILEVVLESFDDLLKYDNDLYQFVQVKELGEISQITENLSLITKRDFDKKCCSKKGILLVNSFMVILLPLCDQKWAFLHDNVLGAIIDKVKALLEQEKVKLPAWDYYQLFIFFFNLGKGKIKHHVLFDPVNSAYLKQRIMKVKKITQESRFVFETTLIQNFWSDVLIFIPSLLWEFKKYAESLERAKAGLKPTTFSIDLVFKIEQFFKQLQFRLSKQHFEYMALQFYEYVIYTIEYILFWSYHEKGSNGKVFTLYKKQEKFLNKAKETFPIEELGLVKNKEILKLSCFTKFGLERLVVDLYFLTDAYKIIVGRCEKIKADEFTHKISKILAKEQKNEALDTDRKNYNQLLKKFIGVYENSPEVIKKYLNEKKKNNEGLASGGSSAINQSKESKDKNAEDSQYSESRAQDEEEQNSRAISEDSQSPKRKSRY